VTTTTEYTDMPRIEPKNVRTIVAWLVIAAGIALLVSDLDHVPLVTLALAVAAFLAGATLMSRPAR
jgi:hypothetical protein